MGSIGNDLRRVVPGGLKQALAGLDRTRIARVFQKGTDPEVDSYSGFFDNGQREGTGLEAYLRAQGVSAVSVVGLPWTTA